MKDEGLKLLNGTKSLELSLNTKNKLSLLHPDIQSRFCKISDDLYNWSSSTLTLKMTEGFRSFETQAKYFAQGRTEPGKIITNAQPGLSAHNYGLAWDVAFEGNDPYLESRKDSLDVWHQYGVICKRHEMMWGGDFKMKDNPHAEKTYGLTLSSLKDLSLSIVWQKIDEMLK